MSTTIRCKMKLNTITERLGSRAKYDEAGKHVGYEDCRFWDAKFSAVYSERKDDENKAFWDATPSGTLELATILQMPWEIGREYYVDLTPAPPPTP